MAQRGAPAFELWSDDEGRQGALTVAGKMTWLGSEAPSDPILFPDDDSQTTLARLRLGLDVTQSEWMDWELAYEQRARWLSGSAGMGAGSSFLPA